MYIDISYFFSYIYIIFVSVNILFNKLLLTEVSIFQYVAKILNLIQLYFICQTEIFYFYQDLVIYKSKRKICKLPDPEKWCC